ncbi:MAG: hypothetical protein R6X32_08100 [Chloroflexota bacterium]
MKLLACITGLLLLTSCTSGFADSNQETASPEALIIPTLVPDLPLVFPRQQLVEGEWIRMTGQTGGRLIVVDRCLRITSDDSHDGSLVIWPPHYNATAENGEIHILDNTGQVMAVVGERVHMGGGGGSHLTYISVPSELAQEIPAECGGPYWISGGIVSSETMAILFPKVPPPGEGETLVYPTAQIQGALIQDGPCLRLEQDKENGTTYLIIWPPDYYYEEHNGTIIILNGRNEIRATAGKMVELGGGHMPGSIEFELDPMVKEHCPGPYLFGW